MKLSKNNTKLLIVVFSLVLLFFTFGHLQSNILESNTPESNKTLSLEVIEEKLLNCKLINNSKESSHIINQQRCIVELVMESYKSGKLTAFNNQLTRIAGKDRAGYIHCHPALHKAGAVLYGKNINFNILLNEGLNREGVCENGLIHGFFDALGVDQEFSLVKWEDFATGCGFFQGDAKSSELAKLACGDGSGHSIWQGTRDYSISFKSCLSLKDQKVVEGCVSGVMMQIPKDDADGKKSYFPYQEIPARWGEVCSAFQQSVVDLAKKTTRFTDSVCGVMAGQGYSVYNADKILFPEKPLTDNTLDEIISNAMEFCDSFTGLERIGCRSEYALQGKFATGFDTDLQKNYCSKLPSELQGLCLQ